MAASSAGSEQSAAVTRHPGLSFRAFVVTVAALMAMNALSVDSMLPALPEIGRAFQITLENDRQWVVTAYLLGFGGAQIIYGPLSDRFGRKPVLIAGISIYALASIIATFSSGFTPMIAARVMQGVGAAATRVLAVSIIRDCYSGRPMARILSLTFIVFLAAPIIAPSLGQLILLVAPWQTIFGMLALFGLIMLAWTIAKLPETLDPRDRLPLEFGRVLQAFRLALTTRTSVGYMLASTLVLGGLFGFINSVQQIFADVLHEPEWFTTVFAGVAGFMAAAALLNSRIVGRFGMHVVSHWALVGFIAMAALHCLVALLFGETLLGFAAFQSGIMFFFGLTTSNFNTIAMEPLGHVAGTASSVQGFVTTFGGALIGLFIGQNFDGTVLPLAFGFLATASLAFMIVMVTERGRMFRPGTLKA